MPYAFQFNFKDIILKDSNLAKRELNTFLEDPSLGSMSVYWPEIPAFVNTYPRGTTSFQLKV